MNTDYQILGIEPGATDDQINKAFKKLAVKHHPDKGGDAEKFKRLVNARDNLINKKYSHAYSGTTTNPFSDGVDIFAHVMEQLKKRVREAELLACYGRVQSVFMVSAFLYLIVPPIFFCIFGIGFLTWPWVLTNIFSYKWFLKKKIEDILIEIAVRKYKRKHGER